MSYDLILDFDYSASRINLFSLLPSAIQTSLVLQESSSSLISNYIVVSTDSVPSFEGVPHLRRVFPQKKLNHKSLTFLSETNGNKASDLIKAESLWSLNLTGEGVKIGILDSGISSKDLTYIKISDCVNFTEDDNCEDTSGHGTFMASIITSTHPDCPGIAPSAEVYALKVFSYSHESYTSWFLEAFNYVISNNITILSLSNGGIDYMDEPFVAKIKELVSLGVIIVSAAGNNGPGFGSLSNPGDQPEVIGVGGLDESGIHVADFSSRGPSLWEIYGGMGRFKPDLVTYSVNILGFYQGRCASNSGTSVSTPIVAGSIALLWKEGHTPGMIKQALVEAATRLKDYSAFEQGAGKLNLTETRRVLEEGSRRLLAFPSSFSNFDEYLFPYNLQLLYQKSPPLIVNFTITHPDLAFANMSVIDIKTSDNISITAECSNIAAYTGTLGVFISAVHHSSDEELASVVIGSGDLVLEIPMRLKIGKSPRKEHRVLWDLGHNLKFPEAGPVIRDEIEGPILFDWRGDHPFSNHLGVYKTLLDQGLVVDFLYDDFSCVDGSLYSTYLLIDPEKSYSSYEISKIQYDMEIKKVSVVIFSDWSDSATLQKQLSYSNFTTAIPGGNIQTINDLLSPYFIELSLSKSFSDTGRITSQKFSVKSM